MDSDFSAQLLCNFNTDTNNIDFNENLKELWSTNWLQQMQLIDLHSLHENTDCNADEKKSFHAAIAYLFAFTQHNFTGPSLALEYKNFLDKNWPTEVNAYQELIVDGEDLNANVSYPEFLLTAIKLLRNVLKSDPDSMIYNWWYLRTLCIHQKVLDEHTQTIYTACTETINKLLPNVNSIKERETNALLLLEIICTYILFHRVQKSNEILSRLLETLDLTLQIDGIFGKLTQHQAKPVPILCLKVNYQSPHSFPLAEKTNCSTNLPKLLELNDDVLLEKVKFMSKEDNHVMHLPSIVQVLILTKALLLLRSQPKDILADEEFRPYLLTLLYQDHGPLAVRLAALLMMVRQEKNKSRTVERSLRQCEEVVKFIESGEKYSVGERLSYFFASSVQPRWEIKKQLGDLMVSLGLIKTALDVYLEIQEWESVIECYVRLDLRHKATEIIKQEIEKQPTVKLYCHLGDTTDDVSWYKVAWEFSKETSSRAQRHWGCYYFARKEYETAIPYLEKSLEINSLQEVIWLRLGYSAIMTENWTLAVHAYLTYTHIEPYGFESWNNLAKALIKLGQKKRAHKILEEALKCNFNSWKVWENFMLVSVDTGNFEDAINAYVRLNELKEKFIDLEIIGIIANAISKDIPDAEGNPSARLREKFNTLLGHQCVQHPSEHKLWEYASILADGSLSCAQKLQKCYSAFIYKNKSWTSIKELCTTALTFCKRLCESSLDAIENHKVDEKARALSQLSSTRLIVQGCVRTVEKDSDILDEVQGELNCLKAYLERCTNELKARM